MLWILNLLVAFKILTLVTVVLDFNIDHSLNLSILIMNNNNGITNFRSLFLCVSVCLCVWIRLPDALDRDDVGLYFQTADMAEALSVPGYNVERLAVPYIPQVTGKQHSVLYKIKTLSLIQYPRLNLKQQHYMLINSVLAFNFLTILFSFFI